MEHPDFIRYKKKNGELSIQECRKLLTYVDNTFNNNTKCINNHRIEMKSESFTCNSLVFSSNDEYLAIVSNKNITVIDCRTGKRVFEMGHPTKDNNVVSPLDTA